MSALGTLPVHSPIRRRIERDVPAPVQEPVAKPPCVGPSEVLAAIRKCTRRGHEPSFYEIAARLAPLGVTRSTVGRHLNTLERDGQIIQSQDRRRTVCIVEPMFRCPACNHAFASTA